MLQSLAAVTVLVPGKLEVSFEPSKLLILLDIFRLLAPQILQSS
jgi:hypothetical protein